ncbi:MAG: hypothetical protein ACREDR_20955, partial [Blastocatellia bacterium]
QMEQWESAVANFKAKAGKPLMDALTDIAQVATPVMKFFGEHEEIAKWVTIMMGAAKVVGMVGQSLGVLKMAGFFNLFKRGDVVKEAVSGSSTTSGREMFEALFKQDAAEEAGRTAGRVGGLGIAAGILGGLGVGLAGYVIEGMISSHLHSQQLEKEAQEAGYDLQQSFTEGFQGDLPQDEKARKEAEGKQSIGKEHRRAQDILGNLHLSEDDSPMTKRLEEIKRGEAAYSNSIASREVTEANRTLFRKSQLEEVRNMIQVKGLPVTGPTELADLISGGRKALSEKGRDDLGDVYEKQLRSLFPDFAEQLDKVKAARDAKIEADGYDHDSLVRHKQAVDDDTASIKKRTGSGNGNDGGTGDGGGGGGSETKRARGGMVLSPVRALIGEAGPEWLTPFHEIRSRAAMGGHRLVINAPMTFHGTSAKDAEGVKRAVKEALSEAGDEIMRGLERYNKGYDPTE